MITIGNFTQHILTWVVACLPLVSFAAVPGQPDAAAAALEPAAGLRFTANKGQWHENVLYRAHIPGGVLLLERNRLTYIFLSHPNESPSLAHQLPVGHNHDHEHDAAPNRKEAFAPEDPWALRRKVHGYPDTMTGHVYHVYFQGATGQPTLTPEAPYPSHENYLVGADEKHWARGVKAYAGVTYQDLWPGIDLRFYGVEGQLKYEFDVAPGTDTRQIQLRYDGIQALHITEEGQLAVFTSVNTVFEDAPECYLSGQDQVKVPGAYNLLGDNRVGFVLGQAKYNHRLVIDPPVLVFSTFTGSTADNWGYTATYGSDGSLFSGGIVNDISLLGSAYPVSPGAYQVSFQGSGQSPVPGQVLSYGSDIALIRYVCSGSQRLWATYVGGSHNEAPHSMWADDQNNLYVFGTSLSNDIFPAAVPGFDKTYNGLADIILFRLNNLGTQMLSGTYYGGADHDGTNFLLNPTPAATYFCYGDDARGEIVQGPDNALYLASCTRSSTGIATAGAFSTAFAGGTQDALVAKFSEDLTQLIWGTYIGSSTNEAAFSLKVAEDDTSVYVTGVTGGGFFNWNTDPNAYQPTYAGGLSDGFIVRLDGNTSARLAYTYLGTTGRDISFLLDLDADQNAYVTGVSFGNHPIRNVLYSVAGGRNYIAKFTPSLDSLVYSTRFGRTGTSASLTPTAFLVDRCENVYVSGWGGTTFNYCEGTLMGELPVTPTQLPTPIFRATTDTRDFGLVVFARGIDSVLFGGYIGGLGAGNFDHVDGGTSRFDEQGVVYQSVCGACGGSNWPTTNGSWSTTNGASNCNNAAFKLELDILDAAIAKFDFNAANAVGCAPFAVTFQNNSINGQNYRWFFGTSANDSSLAFSPSFTYQTPGTYTVTLVAENPGSCNASDTTTETITVLETPVNLDFDLEAPGCGLAVKATNTSLNGQFFEWAFSDGFQAAGASISHNLPAPGDYQLKLVVNPNTVCADSITQAFRVGEPYGADLEVDTSFCSLDVLAQNVAPPDSREIMVYRWGDGSFTQGTSPAFMTGATSHTYPQAGTYTLVLESRGLIEACTGLDSVLIELDSVTVADFRVERETCSPDARFVDASSRSTTRQWSVNGSPLSSSDSIQAFTFSSFGPQEVGLLINEGTPCESDTTLPLSLPVLANAAFSLPPSPICDTLIRPINASTFASGHRWELRDATGTVLVEDTLSAPEFQVPVQASYQLLYIANPDSVCPDSVGSQFAVANPTFAAFSVPDSVCGETIRPVNQSKSATSYRWQLIQPDFRTAVFSGQSPTLSLSDSGLYDLTLITDPNGTCPDTSNATFWTLPFYPADFISTPTEPCGLTLSLVALVDPNVPDVRWQVSDGFDANALSTQHDFQAPGLYAIQLLTNETGLCPDSLTRQVEVGARPTAAFSLPDSTCGAFIFPRNQTPAANTATWIVTETGAAGIGNAPTLGPLPPNEYELVLITDANTLCADTATKRFRALPTPQAAFSYELDACSGIIRFTNESSGGAERFNWQLGVVTTHDVSPEQVVGAQPDYPVQLITFDANNCPDTLAEVLDLAAFGLNNLLMPNTFSPNGDGLNDVLQLYGLAKPCVTQWRVFDRWGSTIFASFDPNARWDGTANGRQVAEGVYVVQVELPDGLVKTQTVTVIR